MQINARKPQSQMEHDAPSNVDSRLRVEKFHSLEMSVCITSVSYLSRYIQPSSNIDPQSNPNTVATNASSQVLLPGMNEGVKPRASRTI